MNNEHKSNHRQYKTIRQIIQELQTFKNQDLIVMVSTDGGGTLKPVKLLDKKFIDNKPYCTIFI